MFYTNMCSPVKPGQTFSLFPGTAMRHDQPGCAPVNRPVALAAASEPGTSSGRARRSRAALYDSSGRPGAEGQRERAVAELGSRVVADRRPFVLVEPGELHACRA